MCRIVTAGSIVGFCFAVLSARQARSAVGGPLRSSTVVCLCAGKDHAGLGAAFAAQSFGPVFRHGKRAGPRIARMPGPGFNLSVGIGLTEIRCATFAPHVRAMRPVCAKGRTALWDIDGAWRALACHDSATHRPEVKYGVGFEADPDHAVTSVESPGVTGLINAGC